MSMVTVTLLALGSSPMCTSPSTPVNRPRTFVSRKCLPTKATSAWPGSTFQSPVAGSSTPPTSLVAADAVVTAAASLSFAAQPCAAQWFVAHARCRQLAPVTPAHAGYASHISYDSYNSEYLCACTHT